MTVLGQTAYRCDPWSIAGITLLALLMILGNLATNRFIRCRLSESRSLAGSCPSHSAAAMLLDAAVERRR